MVDKTIYSDQSALFCSRLVEMRLAAGMTQRDLAAKLQRKQSFVARIELGERRLDFVEAYWYFKALAVPAGSTANQLMDQFAAQDAAGYSPVD
jgi:transcriptional regulator with XRE-family HTH domain